MEALPIAESASSASYPSVSAVLIYLGFAATGVGMALPGSVLPTLLAQWSLADSQAGLLFFLAWMGTSIGALVVRAPISRSLACGNLLLVIATFGIAYGVKWTSFVCMAVYGIGLGMTMTATSLLRCSRNPLRRGVELNRLNLIWSIGACLCPTLAAHSLRIASVRTIFSMTGLLFAVLFVWTVFYERDPMPQPAAARIATISSGIGKLSLWPLTLVLIIFLPTGIESSMGAWIAAYVQRTHQSITTTVTAGTCFWLGLLLSRLLSSTVLLMRRSENAVLAAGLVTVVVGSLLLVATQASLGILPGVFLVGFGLGPVYPLLLAVALQYSGNTLIFFVAGLGSAFLPWLTGITSTATLSLRTGLLVPSAASILMLILGIRLMRMRQQMGHGSKS